MRAKFLTHEPWHEPANTTPKDQAVSCRFTHCRHGVDSMSYLCLHTCHFNLGQVALAGVYAFTPLSSLASCTVQLCPKLSIVQPSRSPTSNMANGNGQTTWHHGLGRLCLLSPELRIEVYKHTFAGGRVLQHINTDDQQYLTVTYEKVYKKGLFFASHGLYTEVKSIDPKSGQSLSTCSLSASNAM